MRCICTGGGRCVVGWCLDSPCGGSITGSFRSPSQYQCGAILPADVCVDAVHRLSVGRNQDCVPACCIILRYKLHYITLRSSSCVIDGITLPTLPDIVNVLPFRYINTALPYALMLLTIL
jgi:hypothetical protein